MKTLFSKRFNMDCDTVAEAMHYFQNRARQLLFGGYLWTQEQTLLKVGGKTWGVKTTFTKGEQTFQSIYVLLSFRGKKLAPQFFQNPENRLPVVTVKDCKIEDFLKTIKIEYVIGNDIIETEEYQAINSFYADERSSRSKIFKMNHIDEGLIVLKEIGASLDSMKAFCLHPLFQADEELSQNYLKKYTKCSPQAILFAMEYRWVANLYLSQRKIVDLKDIQLSPLKEVNQMLWADKIQNYKDFLLYHKKTHPRSNDLDAYFQNWLKKLDISSEKNTEITNLLKTLEVNSDV